MQPDNKPRLSSELLAVADALRHVADQVLQMQRDEHPAVSGTLEATVLTCNVPPVVAALESLSQRLAIQE
jgi:hypothetical protein